MSKRYGRNQRRKAREDIARLEEAYAINDATLVRVRHRADQLESEMRSWARRIVARLGHASAFALEKEITQWNGADRMFYPLPGSMPALDKLERYADAIPQDVIQLFIHHVESQYDRKGGRDMRGQLVLHLRRGNEHEPLYVALSAQQMDEIRYSKDDQYMEFLVRGLARQFALRAEEMRHGR